MATHPSDTPIARPKPTRDEALAIAARRKAARRARNDRLRRRIAVVSLAAFIGPFGVIYAQVASGRDPALAGTQAVAKASASKATTAATGSSSSGSASSDDTTASESTTDDSASTPTITTTTSQAPAAVTTSQS